MGSWRSRAGAGWVVAATAGCILTVPEEEVPVRITDVSVTVDGVEVVQQAAAVAAELGAVTGPDCEPTERLYGSMADHLYASIDVSRWGVGGTVFPGPAAEGWGFLSLSGPVVGVASGGTAEFVAEGAHNELVFRDGVIWERYRDTPVPYLELVLSFDGEVPGGEWQNLGGTPSVQVAPSGLPWCTLDPWEVEGWERVF